MCFQPSWHSSYQGPNSCSVTGPMMTAASLATCYTERVGVPPPCLLFSALLSPWKVPIVQGPSESPPYAMLVCLSQCSSRHALFWNSHLFLCLMCTSWAQSPSGTSHLPLLPPQGSNPHTIHSPPPHKQLVPVDTKHNPNIQKQDLSKETGFT